MKNLRTVLVAFLFSISSGLVIAGEAKKPPSSNRGSQAKSAPRGTQTKQAPRTAPKPAPRPPAKPRYAPPPARGDSKPAPPARKPTYNPPSRDRRQPIDNGSINRPYDGRDKVAPRRPSTRVPDKPQVIEPRESAKQGSGRDNPRVNTRDNSRNSGADGPFTRHYTPPRSNHDYRDYSRNWGDNRHDYSDFGYYHRHYPHDYSYWPRYLTLGWSSYNWGIYFSIGGTYIRHDGYYHLPGYPVYGLQAFTSLYHRPAHLSLAPPSYHPSPDLSITSLHTPNTNTTV